MKRRVIAIAVVLAAVGLVGMNWEPLWRAVMLERVIRHDGDDYTFVEHHRRWGKHQGQQHGPNWEIQRDGVVGHFEFENGDIREGSVVTAWGSGGRVFEQFRWPERRAEDRRTSPPWWPHPPLIDLREFEE